MVYICILFFIQHKIEMNHRKWYQTACTSSSFSCFFLFYFCCTTSAKVAINPFLFSNSPCFFSHKAIREKKRRENTAIKHGYCLYWTSSAAGGNVFIIRFRLLFTFSKFDFASGEGNIAVIRTHTNTHTCCMEEHWWKNRKNKINQADQQPERKKTFFFCHGSSQTTMYWWDGTKGATAAVREVK